MRYTLTTVSGPARRVFKEGVVYDDREITRLARREGFHVTRPNGSQRIRGSGRLLVMSGERTVARFERQNVVEERAQKPTPVAFIRGKLI